MSDDGYEYDDENEGMRSALERQRAKRDQSHIDEAAKLASEEPGMGAAMDRAHESGGKDTFGAVAAAERKPLTDPVAGTFDEKTRRWSNGSAPQRSMGPVEPPPPAPPSVAPPPEPPAFKPADFPAQTSAPAADPMKARRLAALDHVQWLTDVPQPVAAGLADSDIAAAQGRDAEQRRRDNFTRAIQAWMLRKPFEPEGSTEGKDLLARRGLADSEQQRQLTAQEKLAAALKGEKDTGALSEFQKYEMDRNAREDKEKTTKYETKKSEDATQLEADRRNLGPKLKDMGIDPTSASQKDIDRAIQLENAAATHDLARAQFADKRTQEDKNATEGLPANMELAEGANPAPEQLKDLGVVDRGADEVHKLANRMRALLKEDGLAARAGRVLPTDQHRLLTQLQGEMTIALKDSAKLGQISSGDQALIDSIRPDAAGGSSLLRDPASFEKQLQGMETYAEDKRSTAMRSIGARRRGAGGGGTVQMKFPDGSVHPVSPDEVGLARQKGGVEVNGG